MKLAFIVGLAGVLNAAAALKPIEQLNAPELEARIQNDAQAVQSLRQGLRSVVEFVHTQTNLFPAAPQKELRVLSRAEKEAVWNAWQRFLDYVVVLESIERYHARYDRLKGTAKEDCFLIGYAALIAQYRSALEFIERADYFPGIDTILNEPVPEIGLPARTFAKLKHRFLNVAIASQFGAREVLIKTWSDGRQPALRSVIRSDADRVWQAGKGKGHVLTAKNALRIVQDSSQSAWLPVQAGVSEWMGDTKVYRLGQSLISQDQIQQLRPKLQPGDVLLERREWFLSNVGLPGFWPHAALYIGTPEERKAFFADAEIQAWVQSQGEASGDFETFLRTGSPKAYALSLKPQDHEHGVRLLEAISEGVSFTTLEHSADCDALAVLRPRLAKKEKAQAIARAFHYAGRPYDFNFDFATDAELVCTELVYKAYEPGSAGAGLRLPTVEMLGRKVMPANEMVKQFDVQYGGAEEQFDLVIFLDGIERRRTAVEGSLADFRSSCKRPKWHILAQKE